MFQKLNHITLTSLQSRFGFHRFSSEFSATLQDLWNGNKGEEKKCFFGVFPKGKFSRCC